MASFEGFVTADFDAFLPEKWASHAFNRERLEVKLKLGALGRDLQPGLFSLWPNQEMEVTAERPSIFNQQQVSDLTLFFFRSQKERRELQAILDRQQSMADQVQDPAAHHRHIILGVRIGRAGAEAGLWLHQDAWVDRNNLVRRCAEHWERDKFRELITGLPENLRYACGEGLFDGSRPAQLVPVEELLSDFERGGPWMVFGESYDREHFPANAAEFPSRLLELFTALVPLHSFVGWRRDNDYHQIREKLKEHKEKASQKFSSLKKGDQVRVLKGVAAGRLAVVDSLERKGVVKVRLGTMLVALRVDEIGLP